MDIWAWSNEEWEGIHDFIQWLFPLPEPSQFNPNAPLLTPDDVAAFKKESLLQTNMLHAFERLLLFLGLSLEPDGQVVEGLHFSTRVDDVWAAPNHNWLRVTRALRSLTLLGLGDRARALYDRLSAFYHSGRFPIPRGTFQYWTEAIRE
jgi:hypothetical protein